MHWNRLTLALTLFLAAGLSSCATVGVPHIGSIDTRHHPAGTTKFEVSGGVGAALPNQGPSWGAMLGLDTYATPKTSIAIQAHSLVVPVHTGTSITPGLRLGMRYRPTTRLSLGFGGIAEADYALTIGMKRAHYRVGGDVELATSSKLGRRHLSSHAWRFGTDLIFNHSINYRALGDWTLAVATGNPNLRFSYGLSYGFVHYNRSIGPKSSPNEVQGEDVPLIQLVIPPKHSVLVGLQLGLLWGRQ